MLILKLSGRLDASVSAESTAAFRNAVDSNPFVLLDCTNLAFMSSAGIQAIVKAHRFAKDKNGRIGLVVGTDGVMETIQISGINKVIPVSSTRDAGLADLKSCRDCGDNSGT